MTIKKSMLNATELPNFNVEFNIPYSNDIGNLQLSQVVFRYYNAFGDGSINGWQTILPAPTVKFNGIPKAASLSFPGDTKDDYLRGQLGAGYDQRAQYYLAEHYAVGGNDILIEVSGQFQQAAYCSLTVYNVYIDKDGKQIKEQTELVDNNFSTNSPNGNPYIVNNPSVFSYATPNALLGNIDSKSSSIAPVSLPLLSHKISSSDGHVDFFRVDKESSTAAATDLIAADGCSSGYLYATKDISQEILILRIKIPTTFIHNTTPDLIFGDYQCQELTISANKKALTEPSLDFWSIDSRMLTKMMDENGYSYVFFAPNSYVQNLVAEQVTPPMYPPVLTWGEYTGFVLGDPDYDICIRYRNASQVWEGNPANAVCYLTRADNQPVTFQELGEWLPEMYADTMDNFLAGHIGAVSSDQSWPI